MFGRMISGLCLMLLVSGVVFAQGAAPPPPIEGAPPTPIGVELVPSADAEFSSNTQSSSVISTPTGTIAKRHQRSHQRNKRAKIKQRQYCGTPAPTLSLLPIPDAQPEIVSSHQRTDIRTQGRTQRTESHSRSKTRLR